MKKLILILTMITSLLQASGAFFLPKEELFPGQGRYSKTNFEEKVAKGKILSLDSALPVVKAPFGYIPLDGHHDILAQYAMGIEQIPVKVVGDFSQLDEEVFWAEAEKRGWAYLIDLEGKRRFPPKNFEGLVDDPNRYFAAISAKKYPAGIESGIWTGAQDPLWIKDGKDIPFIEFRIADRLYRHGFVYDGTGDLQDWIEKARPILRVDPVEGLHFVDK